MSDILDRGSLLFASLAVLAVSWLVGMPPVPGLPWFSFRFYTPLLMLAVVYVPAVVWLSKLLGGVGGGMSAAFSRDYSPLLTCTAMAWAAATIPVALAGRLIPAPLLPIVSGAACMYFALLMFFAVRTVFGAGNGAAVVVVCLSWVPLVAAAFLWGAFRFLLGWLASPFFLFYAFYYLRGEFENMGAGLRRSQSFRRMLEAAAVNPHDGEAQYQLGLIYQQRRQYSEAIRRFQNAVATDPTQTDAHFQLGRIAREQGRLKDALGHFQTVIDQDDKHSQNEVLRELGAVYITVGQNQDACNELAVYIERRPYDPEGLVYYGQALEGLGRSAESREAYRRAIEAASTAPRYRRRITAKWSRIAQKQLRKVPV